MDIKHNQGIMPNDFEPNIVQSSQKSLITGTPKTLENLCLNFLLQEHR